MHRPPLVRTVRGEYLPSGGLAAHWHELLSHCHPRGVVSSRSSVTPSTRELRPGPDGGPSRVTSAAEGWVVQTNRNPWQLCCSRTSSIPWAAGPSPNGAARLDVVLARHEPASLLATQDGIALFKRQVATAIRSLAAPLHELLQTTPGGAKFSEVEHPAQYDASPQRARPSMAVTVAAGLTHARNRSWRWTVVPGEVTPRSVSPRSAMR